MMLSGYEGTSLPITYDAYLENATSVFLKRFAKLWVGKPAAQMAKDEARKAILSSVADPQLVREVIGQLDQFKRTGLGLMKTRGPTINADALAGALLMLGIRYERVGRRRSYFRDSELQFTALEILLQSGWVMLQKNSKWSSFKTNIETYYHRPPVFADARVLAGAVLHPPVELSIKPIKARGESATTGNEIALRLIATAEGIRRIGGLTLTAAGRVAKPSAAKLAKTVAWKGGAGTYASTSLPDPDAFHLHLWLASGLLVFDTRRRLLLPGPQADELLARPYAEQALRWVAAYESITGWFEPAPDEIRRLDDDDPRSGTFNVMRGALLVALAALPDASAWYLTRDLSDAMYRRVGDRISLAPYRSFREPYSAREEDQVARRQAWAREQRDGWAACELPWIEHALAGPLHHLGLVELGSNWKKHSHTARQFRLTAVGRAVLHDVYRNGHVVAGRAAVVSDPVPCWVVQPNFDVVVFLDSAAPNQVRFVERIGVRSRVDGATASYRLTRESIYAALESGLTLQSIMEALSDGARYPVPDAVSRTIAGWASNRDRLTVHRGARVLEFASAGERDAAIAKKRVHGDAVGDRFVLLAQKSHAPASASEIRYDTGPVRCVTVKEDGWVEIVRAKRDLLVMGEVAAWCEPDPDNGFRWRLTRRSVGGAASRGWKSDAILSRLKNRSLSGVPALIRIGIETWTGGASAAPPVLVTERTLLVVGDDEIARAIAASETMEDFVAGRLGPRAFLVKLGMADAVRNALIELGLAVGEDLAAAPAKEAKRQ